eukprot:403334523
MKANSKLHRIINIKLHNLNCNKHLPQLAVKNVDLPSNSNDKDFENLMKILNPQPITLHQTRRVQPKQQYSVSARVSPLRTNDNENYHNNSHNNFDNDQTQLNSLEKQIQNIEAQNKQSYKQFDNVSSVRAASKDYGIRNNKVTKTAPRGQMGKTNSVHSPSPHQKSILNPKLVGIYDPSEEAYDLSKLNKAILDEDDDAGGAIMKKLYRIHQKFILEINDNLKIDISGQMVEANIHQRQSKGIARPLEDTGSQKTQKKYTDPNNLLSLFLNKNHIADFEQVALRGQDKQGTNNYDDSCLLIKQCFRDKFDKKVDKKKVVEVSVVNLMKYHSFFYKISVQAVKQMLRTFPLIKLSQEQLLYKEGDTQLSFYLIIFGKVLLHSKDLGAIGLLRMGDFIGEEILFDNQSRHLPLYKNQIRSQSQLSDDSQSIGGLQMQNLRCESAYSEGDTYLIECLIDEWKKLKDLLSLIGLKKDYLNIESHLKKGWQQKKVWRQYKSKRTDPKMNYQTQPRITSQNTSQVNLKQTLNINGHNENGHSKREKFHNNLPRIKTMKMLDSLDLNLESPLFSKACKNLGINPYECVSKTYESFQQKGVTQDIVDLRWKHYRSRLFQTINEVLEERQRISKQHKDENNLTIDNINTTLNQTLNNYNSNKSIVSIRGGSNKLPLSLTRSHFSIKDLTEVTDLRLQEEQQRLLRLKNKIQNDTKRIFSEDNRRYSIETKLQQQLEKKKKKQANDIRFNKVRSNQDLLKRNFEHTLEREEQRQRKLLAQKSEKLNDLLRQQNADIERKKKEYEEKHNEVVQKLKEKHEQELQTCISQMNRIENTLQEKQQKHDLHLQEIQSDAQIKNMKWLEKKIKIQEVKEKKIDEDKKVHEKVQKEIEEGMAKKQKEAMRFLKQVQRQNKAKKDNANQLKKEEDEMWREKCRMMDQRFEQAKQQIGQKKESLDHEFELRRELRRIREEEIKKIQERKKMQEHNRKMEILEKEAKVNDNLNSLRKSDQVLNHMKTTMYSQLQKEKTNFLTQVAKLAHDTSIDMKKKKVVIHELINV